MSRPRSALRTVDVLSRCSSRAEIYEDVEGIVWHIMLNYTDVTYGTYGNNKFYMVQLIHDQGKYIVFRKWGRVGAKLPQCASENYDQRLEAAQKSFAKRVKEKSGNKWPIRAADFKIIARKYIYVELDDHEPEGAEEMEEEEIPEPMVVSNLPQQVQSVLELICNTDLITREVAAMNVNLKELPLGRLSKTQISQGYELLNQISTTISEMEELQGEDEEVTRSAKTKKAQTKKKRSVAQARRLDELKQRLKQLSSLFYSLIPHDFGRSLPPTITSMAMIKEKMDLLSVLEDIELTQQLQQEKTRTLKENQTKSNVPRIHPLDAQYEMLGIDMTPISQHDEAYRIIQQYVEKTHAPTHSNYQLAIRAMLKIHRPAEDAHRQLFESIDNHRLLWHGSRLSNVAGILSKGLRIAPPEAPVNGYMFGKGVYFADSVSKSSNYCWATRSQPYGILLLAEVALGESYRAYSAEGLTYQSLIAKKSTCRSLHGVGQLAASFTDHVVMSDGVLVPLGQLTTSADARTSLLYNEFVVYQTEQIKLRYLITVEFIYK